MFIKLPCVLEQRELERVIAVLSRKLHELDHARIEHKAAVKELKRAIDELEKDVRTVAEIVSTRKEHRPVECETKRNYSASTVETIRLDTGEVVEVRAMEEGERQMEIAGMPAALKPVETIGNLSADEENRIEEREELPTEAKLESEGTDDGS